MFSRGIMIVGMVLSWAGWMVPRSFAADFTWTAGPDVLVPLLNTEDADAGVVQDGPNLWVQTALYPDWSRYLGTNLDNLVRQPDALRDYSFERPNGDDAYWTNGIWLGAGRKRYAVVHVEYNYAVPRKAFLWKRRIGLATSMDQGAHWHYEGDILTTSAARSGAPSPAADFQDFGCGDTYLFVDRRNGYFYLYYMTAWVHSPTGWRTAQAMNVARSPISNSMAPGSWKKWSGGQWTEPGLGGAESAVFVDTDSSVVHFNTYLNAFVAIGHDSDSRSWISTCGDLVTQNWQSRDYTFPQRLYWYNWPVDPVTHDRYEIGQNFRLYSAQANVDGVGTKYMNLTLSKNGNQAPVANIIAPLKNDLCYSPGPLTIAATASDSGGSIGKVEFFANQIKIGEVEAAPYVFQWRDFPVGSYRLSARATDNLNATTESAGVDLSALASTFSIWKASRGIPLETPGDTLGSDGRPILVDYALNLDSTSSLPASRLEAGNLTLTYLKARQDVTYQVERSDNLVDWTVTGVDQGVASPLLVTASTSAGLGSRVFLHLKITSP